MLLSAVSNVDAAGNLRTSQVCASGQPDVTFTWDSAPVSLVSTWIDLSLADNGWQAGTFISAGPLDGSAASYTWNGLVSAKTHFVRVNQQGSDGTWYPSPTVTFTTINCTPAGSSNPNVVTNPGADFTVVGFADHMKQASITPPEDVTGPGGTIASCPTRIYIWIQGPSRNALADVISRWALRWTANGTLITTQHDAIYQTNSNYAILILPGDKSLGKTSQYTLTLSAEGSRPDIQSSVYVSC